MSLSKFIVELNEEGNRFRKHFNEPEILMSGLRELSEDVIEQDQVKEEFIRIIKNFITTKERGIYNEMASKHCLITGGPGIGKTMIAKIICKIFVGLGFIGAQTNVTKFPDFDRMRDELFRRRGIIIKNYEIKMRKIVEKINNVNKASIHARKCLSLLVAIKHPNGKQLTSEVNKIIEILESSRTELSELSVVDKGKVGNLEIQADKSMAKTQDDPTLPFKIVNVEDVVSRFVGDTSHRCVEMMNDCLDTVALFDEAYNLCGKSHISEGYGKTALTTINRYMSEYADRLVVIFSGYKKDIEENLFKVQEGLKSRFTNRFEMKPYSIDGLAKIFIIALKKSDWRIKNTPELREMLKEAHSWGEQYDPRGLFAFQGRDMYVLADFTSRFQSELIFEKLKKEGHDKDDNHIRDLSSIKKAIQKFKADFKTSANDDRAKNNCTPEDLMEQLKFLTT